MAFLTLLATAVGIVSALGLLLVGLMEAPWQLLLLGLLVALYGLQRQSWASQTVAQVRDAETNLAVAPDETLSEAISTPGQSESIELSSGPEAPDDGYELTYRGIRYRPSQPATLPSQKS